MALLVHKLNGDDDGKLLWSLVFIPIYVILALSMGRQYNVFIPSVYSNRFTDPECLDTSTNFGLGRSGFILRSLMTDLFVCWFFGFLIIKLDHVVEWSWWINTIPLFVYSLVYFIVNILDNISKMSNIEMDDKEKENESSINCFVTCMVVCFMIPFILFISLLAAHISDGRFSIASVFIPIFITIGLLICFIFFTLYALLIGYPKIEDRNKKQDIATTLVQRMLRQQKFLEKSKVTPGTSVGIGQV